MLENVLVPGGGCGAVEAMSDTCKAKRRRGRAGTDTSDRIERGMSVRLPN